MSISISDADFQCDELGNYIPLKPGVFEGKLTGVKLFDSTSSSAKAIVFTFKLIGSDKDVNYSIWSHKANGSKLPYFKPNLVEIMTKLGLTKAQIKKFNFPTKPGTNGDWEKLINDEATLQVLIERKTGKDGVTRTQATRVFHSNHDTSSVAALISQPIENPSEEEGAPPARGQKRNRPLPPPVQTNNESSSSEEEEQQQAEPVVVHNTEAVERVRSKGKGKGGNSSRVTKAKVVSQQE